MDKQYLSIPIERFEVEEIDNDLAKVKIFVLHEGKNLKKSNFSKLAMDEAQETIKNKPLIGVIEKDKFGNKDFKGHEIEYKIVKKDGEIDIETVYIEQPLGLIPETNDYHYEEINNQQWVVIDAYIWKEYCKDAYEILNESDKKVSMEIKVLESHVDDCGEYWIDKYKYLGITILGDSHNPAMGSDATISLYELSDKQEFISTFEIISNEINKYIKINQESEVGLMSKAKTEKETFSMSISQMEDFIREELKKKTYIYNNYWGESREGQEYYLQDILVEENVCIVVDDKAWGTYYGIPYSFSGDVVTLDYENMKRYVIGDWRPMTDGQVDNTPMVFEAIKTEYNKQFEEFETKIAEKTKEEFDVTKTEKYTALETELNKLKEKYSVDTKNDDEKEEVFDKEKFEAIEKELNDIKEKFSTLKTENERLKKFETDKLVEERKAEEEKLFNQYSELKDVEGFDILKKESEKYTIEELDTKLAVLFAKTYKNKKFSTDDKANEKIKVPIDKNEEKDYKPYGDLFEKYSIE